jgi:hypothetical protein
LVAPIALFPDALPSQLLMASTYPLEVVEAARWSKENASLKGKQLFDAMQTQILGERQSRASRSPPELRRAYPELWPARGRLPWGHGSGFRGGRPASPVTQASRFFNRGASNEQ